LTIGGSGETNPAAGPSTYRRRIMWTMTTGEAVIFIAACAVMVALMLLA
jgi:hypothetical protein